MASITETHDDSSHALQDTNDNSNVQTSTKKLDKRKREAHSDEEWANIQNKRLNSFREKQAEKRKKIQDYDIMYERLKKLEKLLVENNIDMPINDNEYKQVNEDGVEDGVEDGIEKGIEEGAEGTE